MARSAKRVAKEGVVAPDPDPDLEGAERAEAVEAVAAEGGEGEAEGRPPVVPKSKVEIPTERQTNDSFGNCSHFL